MPQDKMQIDGADKSGLLYGTFVKGHSNGQSK